MSSMYLNTEQINVTSQPDVQLRISAASPTRGPRANPRAPASARASGEWHAATRPRSRHLHQLVEIHGVYPLKNLSYTPTLYTPTLSVTKGLWVILFQLT